MNNSNKRCLHCGRLLEKKQEKYCSTECFGLAMSIPNQEKAGTRHRNLDIYIERTTTYPIPTYQQLADKYGLTRERIRMICRREEERR